MAPQLWEVTLEEAFVPECRNGAWHLPFSAWVPCIARHLLPVAALVFFGQAYLSNTGSMASLTRVVQVKEHGILWHSSVPLLHGSQTLRPKPGEQNTCSRFIFLNAENQICD